MAQRKQRRDETSAAMKEGSGARTITFRDVQFTLPDKPTFAVLLAARNSDRAYGQEFVYAQIDLAEAYVGAEQIGKLWELIHDAEAEKGFKAVDEFLRMVDAEYGTESGESSASANSSKNGGGS